MAEKRMFTKKITESDSFLEMPLSTQCLYFHLNMNADDDGFVNNPRRCVKLIGANDDDLKLLIAKAFVLTFESGVIVIKHWWMHNTLRSDRYKPTDYIDEKEMLSKKTNNSYTLTTKWQPNGNQMDPQNRIDKTSIDKTNYNTKVLFAPHDNTSVAIYSLKLKEKNDYQPVYKEDIDFLQTLYPDVNVEQEIRNMVGWCVSNPTQRKTRSGIKAFITRWLNKEQNKLGKVPDLLKDKAREAYIKDVELKQKKEEKGDAWFE